MTPLSVIGHLDCSDKLSELNVVRVGVPLGGGQGQPVRVHLEDVEEFPGLGGDKGEEDTGRSQEPEVTGESSKSFIRQLLVNLPVVTMSDTF